MREDLHGKIIQAGVTFDDVLLVPAYSEVLPNNTILKTNLTKDIVLNIPLIAAAMDTVTEDKTAIVMALLGGIGIVHKNASPEKQAEFVRKVKEYKFDKNEYPDHVLGFDGNLLVGAAIGVDLAYKERVQVLIDAKVDVIVVDSAHGHSKRIIEVVKELRIDYPSLNIVAGNIATTEAAKALYEAGANTVKVGIGPGSICTTRVVAGVGVPQISAINDVYEFARLKDLCLIADGGLKYSGDVVKALAAGAHTVMIGSLFAGTDEAPGEVIEKNGKKYKSYVGMGSVPAMKRGSSDRYFQKGAKKLVPEGIEAIVPYKGKLEDVIFQILGGLRAGMGYTGSSDVKTLRHASKFVKITSAGLRESHPHDVIMEKDADNYSK